MHSITTTLRLMLLTAPLLTATALGQGGDDCSTAVPLSGEAYILVDNEFNGDSGFLGGAPCDAATGTMLHDQFFQWSPTEPGDYAFFATGRFFGNMDTKVELYEGAGCSATCIDTHDDPGSLHSLVHKQDAQVGDQLLVRFGGWFTGSSWNSLPTLEFIKLEGDTCKFPSEISGSGQFEFNIRQHSASGFVGGTACASIPADMSDKFFRWTATQSGDYWFDSQFSNFDAYVAVYGGGDCMAPCLGVGTPQADSHGQGQLLVTGILAGEEYLVRIVADHPLLFTGTMDLGIYRDLCGAPDMFEPNDTIAQATPIAPALYQNLAVNGAQADADFFSFTLLPGEAAFAYFPETEGGSVFMQGHGADGVAFDYLGIGSPTEALFVNTQPWASTFYLQVAASNGNQFPCSGYDLQFSIGPDPCVYPGDDPFGEDDTCQTAVPLFPGIHADQFVSILDPDFYSIQVPGNSNFQVEFIPNLLPGSNLLLILRPDCTSSPVAFGDHLGLQWTNPSSTPASMILEVRIPLAGTYTNTCASYDMFITSGDSLGSAYCSPAVPNSSGRPGRLEAQGSLFAADNQLSLRAYDLPWVASTAFFVASQTQGLILNPGGSQGNLCLGGAIVRFNRDFGMSFASVYTQTLDLTDVPEPPSFNAIVMSGETWNFQLWHRDIVGVSTSNFTEAISITFQ